MKFRFALVAGAAISLLGTTAQAVDWGGYVRIGPGQKQNAGDGKRCFDGLTGVGHGGIGRLGNECATYGEFQLSQGMQAGGVNYKALLMSSFSGDGSDANGANFQLAQVYVEAKGYDVAPEQTFWIGRRYYNRADVHFDDAFFINMTGTGAGVEGIKPGAGSLGLAVFRTDDQTAGNNDGTRFNLDWEGINTNPGGKLRFTGTYTKFNGTGGKDGYGLSLQHNQTGIFGGENTLWAQLAQGSAALNQSWGGATNTSGFKSWRIVDSLAWLNGPLTGQTLVQYGQSKDPTPGQGTTKFWSVGGRAAYAITKNFKLQGELGYSKSKLESNPAQNVTKLTIAPTLTVGPNYYDRPELRFYISAFNYNNAYKLANGQTKTSRTAAGFQAEIWF